MRIVSSKVEFYTSKWRREGNSQSCKQIGAQVILQFCAGTCSANLDQARVGEPRIFKRAMLRVSYFFP